MKYALIAYVAVMALVLALKPAGKTPCGPGVLCIRPQKQVQAELSQRAQPPATHLAAR